MRRPELDSEEESEEEVDPEARRTRAARPEAGEATESSEEEEEEASVVEGAGASVVVVEGAGASVVVEEDELSSPELSSEEEDPSAGIKYHLREIDLDQLRLFARSQQRYTPPSRRVNPLGDPAFSSPFPPPSHAFLGTGRNNSPLLGLLKRSGSRLPTANSASVRNGSVVHTALDVVAPLGRGAFVVASRETSSVALELCVSQQVSLCDQKTIPHKSRAWRLDEKAEKGQTSRVDFARRKAPALL